MNAESYNEICEVATRDEAANKRISLFSSFIRQWGKVAATEQIILQIGFIQSLQIIFLCIYYLTLP